MQVTCIEYLLKMSDNYSSCYEVKIDILGITCLYVMTTIWCAFEFLLR